MTTSTTFETAPLDMRDDLRSALARTWRQLGESGSWLDGSTRVAVAAEVRNAASCTHCLRRKEALSPHTVEGEHNHPGTLPDPWVEVIHMVVNDSGRITERWYCSVRDAGVAEEEYIEVLSVTALTVSMDAFARGIGMPLPALPSAAAGTPMAVRPAEATPGPGWTASIAPENAVPELGEVYEHGTQYVRRALSLVPDEARRFWDLMHPLYLPDPTMIELEHEQRAISRAQIEFLAARVSALHGCFY